MKEYIGIAVNTKSGAALQTESGLVYVDRDEWPSTLDRKKLRVRGIEKRVGDLPTFVQKPGEPIKSGIPVQTEEEAEKGRWRTVLTDFTFEPAAE